MEDRKMQIITELMEELQGLMEYGSEDFDERLGRKKPEVEVEILASGEGEPMAEMEDEMMEESPEDKLKNRLMKLRGA
jgi:hypothetical protein